MKDTLSTHAFFKKCGDNIIITQNSKYNIKNSYILGAYKKYNNLVALKYVPKCAHILKHNSVPLNSLKHISNNTIFVTISVNSSPALMPSTAEQGTCGGNQCPNKMPPARADTQHSSSWSKWR